MDTRASLIEVATRQVRRQGYAGFSYADLAAIVGIRKASIHHHFPTKEDLGLAIVAAYTAQFRDGLEAIEAASPRLADRLDAYAGLYRAGLDTGEGCLCGVLASEVAELPPAVQDAVRAFFAMNLGWLAAVLADASDDPARDADAVLATLQGGLFVTLSLRDVGYFDRAAAGLLHRLAPPDGARLQA